MLTKAEDIINLARLGFNGLEAHFLTLTFTPDTLAITSEKTRRRYVSRFLKQYYGIYIANKDFGTKNNREHYHALCLTNGIIVNFTDWHKYGAIKMEHVRIDESSSPIKITKYINKLSFHALKESASAERAIYSRL